MRTDTPTARPAERGDIPRAVQTLSRAFADYPFTRHTITQDGYQARLARFHELFLSRVGLDYGRVWVVGDGAAVAVWTTPEAPGAAAVIEELTPVMAEIAGDRAGALEQAEVALAPFRPTAPAWFLGSIGVDPARQGSGLGSAVIRPGLAEASRAGVPAYLETSTEHNVRFYERLGFRTTGSVVLPGGPPVWAMVRPPAI